MEKKRCWFRHCLQQDTRGTHLPEFHCPFRMLGKHSGLKDVSSFSLWHVKPAWGEKAGFWARLLSWTFCIAAHFIDWRSITKELRCWNKVLLSSANDPWKPRFSIYLWCHCIPRGFRKQCSLQTSSFNEHTLCECMSKNTALTWVRKGCYLRTSLRLQGYHRCSCSLSVGAWTFL